jgi:hypothetical protein
LAIAPTKMPPNPDRTCDDLGEYQIEKTGIQAAAPYIEQLFTLHEFLENLGQHGLKFEEKECV